MHLLIITVLLGSLQRPAYTAYIPYPSRYTCEHARDTQVNPTDFIRLLKHQPKHQTARVRIECTEGLPAA